MSEVHAPDANADRGLVGALTSWLQSPFGEAKSPSESGSNQGPGPHGHPFGSARVLVADDNAGNLKVISALLQLRGLVPLLAADGAEAVSLAIELPFDLILMDMQMPILDGLGATSAIRRFEIDNSRPAVPVIAYSSACPTAAVLARHGLNGSLSKPCEARELDECLVRWCPAFFRPGGAVGRVSGRGQTGGQSAGSGGAPVP